VLESVSPVLGAPFVSALRASYAPSFVSLGAMGALLTLISMSLLLVLQ